MIMAGKKKIKKSHMHLCQNNYTPEYAPLHTDCSLLLDKHNLIGQVRLKRHKSLKYHCTGTARNQISPGKHFFIFHFHIFKDLFVISVV